MSLADFTEGMRHLRCGAAVHVRGLQSCAGWPLLPLMGHVRRHLEIFTLASTVDPESFTDWGLPCFPEVLCTLPKLRSLCLENQQLLVVPQAISNMCCLQHLSLR